MDRSRRKRPYPLGSMDSLGKRMSFALTPRETGIIRVDAAHRSLMASPYIRKALIGRTALDRQGRERARPGGQDDLRS